MFVFVTCFVGRMNKFPVKVGREVKKVKKHWHRVVISEMVCQCAAVES